LLGVLESAAQFRNFAGQKGGKNHGVMVAYLPEPADLLKRRRYPHLMDFAFSGIIVNVPELLPNPQLIFRSDYLGQLQPLLVHPFQTVISAIVTLGE
jgi:hypothetical protein